MPPEMVRRLRFGKRWSALKYSSLRSSPRFGWRRQDVALDAGTALAKQRGFSMFIGTDESLERRSSRENLYSSCACFRLPGETRLCPRISLQTICTGSSAGGLLLPRSSQRAFESKDTSRITLGPPAVRQVWPQVVPIPEQGLVFLRKSNQTRFANTSGMPLELFRSPRASEDKQHAIALKETVTPISCLTDQCYSSGQNLAGDKIPYYQAEIG